jgi:HAD superfamily hydrolase (TIGR01509 family)
MNRSIIFDLDGVLVDSKEIHFVALNRALSDINEKFVISKQEQANVFEGLTTKSKLDILTMTKGLPKTFHDLVWKNKQQYSAELFSKMNTDDGLVEVISFIKKCNIKVGVASNAIRDTLDSCLKTLGIYNLIDFSLSNEDVINPKPNPEIYLSMMLALGSDQASTVIFEDSSVGIQAANNSGAKVFVVKSRKDITLDLVKKAMATIEA